MEEKIAMAKYIKGLNGLKKSINLSPFLQEDSPATNQKPETTPPQITPPPPPPPPLPSCPGDSIGEHVWCQSVSILSHLVSSCPTGVSGVLCISGRSQSVFPTAWSSYTSQISSLETDISNYMKVSSL